MNTKINYLYRDACNYKIWNEAIVEGQITPEQEADIRAAIMDGESFIPADVDLPEHRFDTYTEDDVDEFELVDFELTSKEPTWPLTVGELVDNFLTSNADWATASLLRFSAEEIRDAAVRHGLSFAQVLVILSTWDKNIGSLDNVIDGWSKSENRESA